MRCITQEITHTLFFFCILSCWKVYYKYWNESPKEGPCVEIIFLGKIVVSWKNSESRWNSYYDVKYIYPAVL